MPEVRRGIELRCIVSAELACYAGDVNAARRRGSEPAMADRLLAALASWRRVLEERGGAMVKILGETVLATSGDPAGLLGAVLEAMAGLSADTGGARAHARAGLHVGSVVVAEDGDVLGADAALARSVMQEARTNQLLLTEAFAAMARSALPSGTTLVDLGDRLVRGFDTPVHLLQVRSASLADPGVADAAVRGDAVVRVLLVDDDRLLRDTIGALLKLDPDLDVVGAASNGRQAVARVAELRPDVVLMDIDMPEMNGIEATRRIKQAWPRTEVLILTKFGDDENVFEAIRAGALGYILKDAGADEIGPAIRAVHRQEGVLSPSLAPRVMREFARISRSVGEARALFAEMSRREMEVLELLARGMRNRAIADALFLSEKTVKNHISSILAKLHVNDRTEAALLAQQHGLG